MSLSDDVSRVAELIWKGDNRSAILAMKQMKDQNAETTDALKADNDEQAASFAKVREESSALRDSLVGLAGMVGIGGVAFGIKDLIEEGEHLQTAQAQLRQALKSTGLQAVSTQAQLERMAESLSTRGGFATTQNLAALTQFVGETHSATQAQQMLTLATNIARRTGEDLATTQEAVAGAYEGRTRALAKLLGPIEKSTAASIGLTTAHQQEINQIQDQATMMGKMGGIYARNAELADHLTSRQVALAQVQNQLASGHIALSTAMRVFAGSTQAYSDTTAGQISNVKNAFHNLTEELGTALLPAMDKIVHIAAGVAEWMAKNKSLVLDLTLGFAGLGTAMLMSKGIKAVLGLKNDLAAVAKAFGITGAAGETAGAEANAGAEAATIGWRAFMTSTIVGLVLVGLVELIEHWRQVEAAVVSVWQGVSGTVTSAWRWIENTVSKGVDWVWSKLKWLGDEAKKLIADTPIGGLIGFGSNLLGGHVGRAFGDLAQGVTGGVVQANGSVGLPYRNVFESGTPSHVTVTPQSNVVLRTTDREIGRATVRWALNDAARGASSLSGGSLVTGRAGLPVGG